MPDKLSGTLSQSGKLSGVLSTKNRLTGQLSMAVNTITAVAATGTGNAITDLSVTNGTITATYGATFLTEHQDISGKMDIPAGGSAGQVLAKTANGYEWVDPISLDAYVTGEVVTFTDNR